MIKLRIALFCCLWLVVLAGCTAGDDATNATPDTLLNDGVMPKVVVTVLAPTLSVEELAQAAPTQTPFQVLTSTPPPTQTPTPYVGSYLGDPTTVAEDGSFLPAPTIPPLSLPSFGGDAVVGFVPAAPIGAPAAGAPLSNPGAPVDAASCSVPVADQFANSFTNNPSVRNLVGCPVAGGFGTTLVVQDFEQGQMYWRDTRQIYVISNNGSFWRVPDSWADGMPESDPAFAPPPSLLQPIRGFGFAWRSNETFRNALGWAVNSELPVSSFWQDFERGSLFVASNGTVVALPGADSGQYLGGLPQ